MTKSKKKATRPAATPAAKSVHGSRPIQSAKTALAAPRSKAATPAVKAAKPGGAAKLEPAKAGKSGKKAPKTVGSLAAGAIAHLRGEAAPTTAVSLAGAGDAVCREVACENLATTAHYCRLHYIKNWKKIKRKEVVLSEGKLNQYIEELVAKYPDKYIEAIRYDLANDKEFAKVIADLDLDEGVDDFEGDAEGVEIIVDTIKREFDDEGDGF